MRRMGDRTLFTPRARRVAPANRQSEDTQSFGG